MATMELTVHPATPSDIPAIQALAHRIWHDCYPSIISLEQIAYMLEKMYGTQVLERELASGVAYELARLGGEAVGFLSYSIPSGDRQPISKQPEIGVRPRCEKRTRELTLHKLYLLKELQGKGLGQQLLAHLKNQARELGAATISLRVNRQNQQAIAAYQRAGFVIVETNVADIGGGFVMDDYIMKCQMKPQMNADHDR